MRIATNTTCPDPECLEPLEITDLDVVADPGSSPQLIEIATCPECGYVERWELMVPSV